MRRPFPSIDGGPNVRSRRQKGAGAAATGVRTAPPDAAPVWWPIGLSVRICVLMGSKVQLLSIRWLMDVQSSHDRGAHSKSRRSEEFRKPWQRAPADNQYGEFTYEMLVAEHLFA